MTVTHGQLFQKYGSKLVQMVAVPNEDAVVAKKCVAFQRFKPVELQIAPVFCPNDAVYMEAIEVLSKARPC